MMRVASLILLICMAAACAPRFDLPGPAIEDAVIKQDVMLAADGRKITLRRYEADNPQAIIVAAHGFNDYSQAFEVAGPWFAGQDISLIALDPRGFGRTPKRGRWPGTEALADDLATLVRGVRRQSPETPIYLLGVSMGGAVATVAAARHELPIDGLVLSGPAFWGWSQLNPLYRTTLWTVAHVAPWYYLTGEGLRLWPSDNVAMLRALGQDRLIIRETRVDAIYGLVTLMDDAFAAAGEVQHPTLILFGNKDEIVPVEPVEAVIAQLPGPKRFVRYADGWHMLLRDLQRERVYADMATWIKDRTAQLPSGEEVALAPKSGH